MRKKQEATSAIAEIRQQPCKTRLAFHAAASLMSDPMMACYPNLRDTTNYSKSAYDAIMRYGSGISLNRVSRYVDAADEALESLLKQITPMVGMIIKQGNGLHDPAVAFTEGVKSLVQIATALTDEQIEPLLKSITIDEPNRKFTSEEVHKLVDEASNRFKTPGVDQSVEDEKIVVEGSAVYQALDDARTTYEKLLLLKAPKADDLASTVPTTAPAYSTNDPAAYYHRKLREVFFAIAETDTPLTADDMTALTLLFKDWLRMAAYFKKIGEKDLALEALRAVMWEMGVGITKGKAANALAENGEFADSMGYLLDRGIDLLVYLLEDFDRETVAEVSAQMVRLSHKKGIKEHDLLYLDNFLAYADYRN